MNSFFDSQVQLFLFSFEDRIKHHFLFFLKSLRAARSAKASPTFLFWFSGSCPSSAKRGSRVLIFSFDSQDHPSRARHETQVHFFVIQDHLRSTKVKSNFFILLIRTTPEPREARKSSGTVFRWYSRSSPSRANHRSQFNYFFFILIYGNPVTGSSSCCAKRSSQFLLFISLFRTIPESR